MEMLADDLQVGRRKLVQEDMLTMYFLTLLAYSWGSATSSLLGV